MIDYFYKEVLSLFASELLDVEKEEDQAIVLSVMSNLVFHRRHKLMDLHASKTYFTEELLPELEKMLDAKFKTNK